NVSDIENLIYVQEQVGIQVGELLFAGILIAALGAVMDVSMSISSTLQEIHDKNPGLTGRQLFYSGMTVGRDMMGTMSNTLILAFAGGSINTLVLFYAYAYSYTQIINMYDIAIEIMQGVSASLGVVLTVPFVSAVAAWMLSHAADRPCRNGRETPDGTGDV
ncbi:MAG: YibE/F family protein, partial [Butyricicoccus sp.]